MEGLDQYTGFQLLQWSIEEGLRQGCLIGTPFKSETGLKVGSPPICRVALIGEGGLKSRTVTADEGWLTTFLSPFGHELSSWVNEIPEACAGISAAAQCYEFIKSISTNKDIDDLLEEGKVWCSTSDMEMASELLPWDSSKSILKGFTFDLENQDYITAAIDLLLSPVCLDGSTDHRGLLTKRGCLMGRPGTKGTLMLFVLVAEAEARFRYLGVDILNTSLGRLVELYDNSLFHFRNAGDDQAAIGPRSYLDNIRNNITDNGGKMNLSKCFISPDIIFYAEEIFFKDNTCKIYSKDALWNRDYYSTCHVDSLKVRLLSPVTKVSMGDSDETNPVIGKAYYFARKIGWLPDRFKSFGPILWARFKHRFKVYADWKDPFSYLPMEIGGLGLYGLSNQIDLADMLQKENPLVIRALNEIIDGRGSTSTRSTITSYRTNTSYRGLVSKMDAAEQIYGALDSMDQAKVSSDELREKVGIDETTWSRMRHMQKKRTAKKYGYIAISDILSEIERPTYFKQVLLGETDIINAQSETKEFLEQEKEILDICKDKNMSLEEVLESEDFQAESLDYTEARAKAAQKKWDIELFTSDLAAGKVVPDFMRIKPEERSIHKGFNSVPFSKRKTTMINNLIKYPPKSFDIGIDSIIDVYNGNKSISHRDEFFVPEDRLRNTCKLTTPLWGHKIYEPVEADPLPVEVAKSILERKERCMVGLYGNPL
jgi:hypothetical protein